VFDLTDAEALEQLEWNAAWQYALDVVPEEAHGQSVLEIRGWLQPAEYLARPPLRSRG
jgi:hypothetical protein